MNQLKSKLATLDRKITAELAPTHEVPDDRKGVAHDENGSTENKQEPSQKSQPEIKVETTVNTVNVHTTDSPQERKPSMVAEPQPRYPMLASAPHFSVTSYRNLTLVNRQIKLIRLVCLLFFCIND